MKFLSNKKVLLISTEKWGVNFVSKHHYACELINNGNIVYFLNPPDKTIKDFIIEKLFNYDKLYLIKYPLKFRGLNKLPKFINDYITKPEINKILKTMRYIDLVWSFDPFRYQNMNLFNAKKKIYYCADPHLTNKESIIAKSADLVLTPSNLLADQFKGLNDNVFNIGHGVSNVFFEDINEINGIVMPGRNKLKVGCVGNLNNTNISKIVLHEIIITNSNLDFIFIGPTGDSNLSLQNNGSDKKYFEKLMILDNVYFLGAKHYTELPSYYKHFDVFLTCYDEVSNPLILSNNHKTMEFLSTGKAIVSHFMDEFKSHRNLLNMPDENKSLSYVFNDTIKNLDYYNNEELEYERIKYAKNNTYDNKLSYIDDLLYV